MRATNVAVLVIALAACLPLSAEEGNGRPAGDLALWSDPTFQKQFLGSFGAQADIEPRVTVVEREQMEKVLPLLGSDPPAAIRELEKITRSESSAVLDFTLGNLRFQQDDLGAAEAHFATALAKFPSFRRAHKNLGLIRVRQGRFDEAARSLTRVIELGGGDGLTFGLLGYAYSSSGSFVSAESAYRSAVLLQPEQVDWKLGLTRSLLKQQKYGDAATLCGELIAVQPERADLWLLQANAYIGLGQPLKAAENYEVVRRLGSANAAALHTLGDIYVNEGLMDLAAAAYADALGADPGEAADRPLRCVEILAQRGALGPAGDLLDQVREAYGERLVEQDRKRLLKLQARILMGKESVKSDAGGRTEAGKDTNGGAAVAALEEIVAIDPLDGEALILLGQHYARAQEPERAIFYFERAESLEAYEADARVRHAQLLVSQARYREAVPLLKRAQEIKPREDVARFLEQVERIARTRG
jgi:tetratricopeptide (TPR) repeat protein